MLHCGSLFKRQESFPNSGNRPRLFPRVNWLVSLLLLACSVIGCIAAPKPARNIVPTATPQCPTSVFTARDMQARVDCHPADYRLRISKETVVLFAYPSPVVDWVGPVFVIHVPSVSEVVVNYDGSLFEKHYETPEGQAAIETVLNDPALMASILGRAREIQKGPNPPFIFR